MALVKMRTMQTQALGGHFALSGHTTPPGGPDVCGACKIYQREGCAQVIVILLQATEAHLYESEHPLQDSERGGGLPSDATRWQANDGH